MKKLLCLLLSVCLLVPLSACGGNGSAGKIMSYSLTADPVNIDPQIATDYNALLIIQNVYEGLLTKTENGELTEGVASSYKVSEDGLRYTFTLRSDAKWMHQDKDDAEIPGYNQAVTAADFVFAFRRVVDPAIQSPYATSFYCIQNAQQIHQGSASVDQLGVTAVNDTTLVIQLAYPNALFLELMSSTAAMPCHEAFFKQTNGRYGLSMSTVLSNGPFYVKEWSQDHYVRIRENPVYASGSPTVAGGANLTVRTQDEAYDQLISGNIDTAVLRVKDYQKLSSKEFAGMPYSDTVWGIGFNCASPVFQNTELRLALIHAFDHTGIEQYLPAGSVAADGIVPPSVSILEQSYRDLVPASLGYSFDLSLAQQYLASGSSQTNLSQLNQMSVILTEDQQELFQFISQQWQKNLQVYLQVEVLDQETYQARIAVGEFDCAILSFSSNANTPQSILSSFVSDSTLNRLHYQSSAVEQSLAQANLSGSLEEAVQCYQHAEQAVLTDGAFIPLYYQQDYFVTRANVSHLIFEPSSKMIYFKYAEKD